MQAKKEMQKISREGTSSAGWDDSERSINNPEDVYFNTFNTDFISLWVCVSFIAVALSHSREEQQLCALMVILDCAML